MKTACEDESKFEKTADVKGRDNLQENTGAISLSTLLANRIKFQ